LTDPTENRVIDPCSLASFFGVATCIWGCRYYTIGNVYDDVLGGLGFLSLLGLIVLIFLPDKHK